LSIDHFNLRNFDLNLMLAFDALIQEESVTRAAACLKVQQPAMSHALATLRVLLADELFIRIGHRMVPTLRARELHRPIREVLRASQALLLSQRPFDPSRDERIFRVGVTTQLESLILSNLMADLSVAASRVKVLISHTSRERVFNALDEEHIDLAIGFLPGGAAWHQRRALLDTTHVCCFNPRLLPFGVPISLSQYRDGRHAMISAKNSMAGYLEEALSKEDLQLNVVLAAPHFLTLLAAVAQTPMIATLPARVAAAYTPMFGLIQSVLPFALQSLPIDLLWHARSEGDFATRWLRERIMLAAQTLSTEKLVGE